MSFFQHRSSQSFYRSVFVSDFHMGSRQFDAAACARFLRSIECENLYLVGDILDGWKLKKNWRWPPAYTDILHALLDLRDAGTRIYYLPGNHDEELREMLPVLFRRQIRKLGLYIRSRLVHETADGRRFLVLHGDQFDTRILSPQVLKTHHAISHFVSHVLADLWNLIRPDRPIIEVHGRLKRFSLAKHLSKHGRLAIQALNNFEGLIYKMVKKQNFDGVICGHTHIPVIKPIRDITYANCGSWLRDGHTAVVEHVDGRLELVDCPAGDPQPAFDFGWLPASQNCRIQNASPGREKDIADIQALIRALWRPAKKRGLPSFSHNRTALICPGASNILKAVKASDTAVSIKGLQNWLKPATNLPVLNWKTEPQDYKNLWLAS